MIIICLIVRSLFCKLYVSKCIYSVNQYVERTSRSQAAGVWVKNPPQTPIYAGGIGGILSRAASDRCITFAQSRQMIIILILVLHFPGQR